jgi:hypothetical protein
MNKTGLIRLLFALLVTGFCLWFHNGEAARAQQTDLEKELRDHDKSVSDDKLERVRSEARSIQGAIISRVRERFPQYELESQYFSDPANQAIGRRGQTRFDSSWRSPDKTQIRLNITFAFDADEANRMHRKSADGIAMGEFFRAPDFVGTEGILVKNVQFNKKTTNVGLHFVKGRAIVMSYITNQSRATNKNEKELIEFVRAIAPLIIAKENFNDL